MNQDGMTNLIRLSLGQGQISTFKDIPPSLPPSPPPSFPFFIPPVLPGGLHVARLVGCWHLSGDVFLVTGGEVAFVLVLTSKWKEREVGQGEESKGSRRRERGGR